LLQKNPFYLQLDFQYVSARFIGKLQRQRRFNLELSHVVTTVVVFTIIKLLTTTRF